MLLTTATHVIAYLSPFLVPSLPLQPSPISLRFPRSFYSSLAAGYRTAPCQLTDTALLTYRFARGRVTCSTSFSLFPIRISSFRVNHCDLVCASLESNSKNLYNLHFKNAEMKENKSRIWIQVIISLFRFSIIPITFCDSTVA